MFRKIALFLTLVLVIGALSACAAPGELQMRDLTESQKERILQAYTTSFDELRWGVEDDSYYGNYDGYDVFLITDKSMSSGNYQAYVGRYVFGHSRNVYFDVYGYRDGEIKPLRLLYNEGEVSEETVKTLSQKNNYGKNKVFSYLTETLQEEVEAAWKAYCHAIAGDIKVCWRGSDDYDDYTNGSFEYVGSIEGYDILYYYPAGGASVLSGLQIGEHWFAFGSTGHDIYAFKHNKLYVLSELYDDGKIAEKSIITLWEKHKELYPVYYKDKATTK